MPKRRRAATAAGGTPPRRRQRLDRRPTERRAAAARSTSRRPSLTAAARAAASARALVVPDAAAARSAESAPAAASARRRERAGGPDKGRRWHARARITPASMAVRARPGARAAKDLARTPTPGAAARRGNARGRDGVRGAGAVDGLRRLRGGRARGRPARAMRRGRRDASRGERAAGAERRRPAPGPTQVAAAPAPAAGPMPRRRLRRLEPAPVDARGGPRLRNARSSAGFLRDAARAARGQADARCNQPTIVRQETTRPRAAAADICRPTLAAYGWPAPPPRRRVTRSPPQRALRRRRASRRRTPPSAPRRRCSRSIDYSPGRRACDFAGWQPPIEPEQNDHTIPGSPWRWRRAREVLPASLKSTTPTVPQQRRAVGGVARAGGGLAMSTRRSIAVRLHRRLRRAVDRASGGNARDLRTVARAFEASDGRSRSSSASAATGRAPPGREEAIRRRTLAHGAALSLPACSSTRARPRWSAAASSPTSAARASSRSSSGARLVRFIAEGAAATDSDIAGSLEPSGWVQQHEEAWTRAASLLGRRPSRSSPRRRAPPRGWRRSPACRSRSCPRSRPPSSARSSPPLGTGSTAAADAAACRRRRRLCVERMAARASPARRRLPRDAVPGSRGGSRRLPRHAARALFGRPRVPARPPRRPRPPRPEPRLVVHVSAASQGYERHTDADDDSGRPRRTPRREGRRGRLPHPTPCAAARPRRLDDGPRRVRSRVRGERAAARLGDALLPHHWRPRAALVVQDAPEHGDRARGPSPVVPEPVEADDGCTARPRAPRGGGGDGGDAPPPARLAWRRRRRTSTRCTRTARRGGKSEEDAVGRDCRRQRNYRRWCARVVGGRRGGAAAAARRGGDGGGGRQRLPPLPACSGARPPTCGTCAPSSSRGSTITSRKRWRRRPTTRWRRTVSRGRWCPSRR